MTFEAAEMLERMERGYQWRKKRQAETVDGRRARYDALQYNVRTEFGAVFLGDLVWYRDMVWQVITACDSIGNSAHIRSLPAGVITGPGREMACIFITHTRPFRDVSDPVHFTRTDENGKVWEFTGLFYEPQAQIEG